MAVWLCLYFRNFGSLLAENVTEMNPFVFAAGATIGTGTIFTFWAFGGLVLGALVLFTRPRS